MGQTDVAIGIAGMNSILDYAGTKDHFGKILRVTAIAISDEICSSASFIIQYAALSFRDPNGLCPSSFAKYFTLSLSRDSSELMGYYQFD